MDVLVIAKPDGRLAQGGHQVPVVRLQPGEATGSEGVGGAHNMKDSPEIHCRGCGHDPLTVRPLPDCFVFPYKFTITFLVILEMFRDPIFFCNAICAFHKLTNSKSDILMCDQRLFGYVQIFFGNPSHFDFFIYTMGHSTIPTVASFVFIVSFIFGSWNFLACKDLIN